MKYVFSQVIFIGFVLAMYFAIEMLHKRDMKHKENRLFVLTSIFSAIWSLGFFCVILQTEPQNGYFWRGIGMIGTFGYLITAQMLICCLSAIKKVYCRMAEWFSFFGIVIYFHVIQKDQVTYTLSDIGMTYSFHQTFWNNIYIFYIVAVAFNQVMISIHMLRRPKANRFVKLAKGFLAVELAMILGMLLDTIFPLFGRPAIPGSTIGQFAGLVVMYYSISFINHSRITVDNMSEFIYYSLTVPVLVFDSKEELQIMNDTAYSFLGVHMEKASIEQIFFVKREEIFQFEDQSQSIDAVCFHEQKYCNLTINKIYDRYGDKIGYIIMVSDLSERIKAMKQLEAAMKEAKYANRAKSLFLANMSHEIRTPMNAIIGFSELLLRMDIGDEIRSHVQDIKFASHNLLAIINDILDISKIESGKMELIPDKYYTASLLNDVVLIIEAQAKKKSLQFEVKIDETIPKALYGDKVRIRGVLINLLNNAVKYTQQGSVTFEVFTISKYGNRIRLAFRVTDTGAGIKKENIKTLFDSFARLDQRAHYGIEGSGLGLAISKGYVNLMGGEIKVSSEYGKGSVFTVEIEQGIIDANPMEKGELQGRKELEDGKAIKFTIRDTRVLVVDDNPVNLKVAQGILRTYGLAVDTASSGKEAIEICKTQNYKIVFIDQMMPEINGPRAMRQIRQLNDYYAFDGEGKIIVLTANAIKGTRDILMKQGFDEYLGKPLNIAQLERLLCRYIPQENIIFNEDATSNDSVSSEEVKYIKEAIPEIDVDMGIAHCGGKLQDYLKVLEISYKYGEKQLNELNHLWEQKEYEAYHIKVHALKSTSLNIGAKEISVEAKKQEEAVLNGDYDYIDENIKKLAEEYMKIIDKIEDVLVHYDMISVKPEKETPKLDERMIGHIFKNIEKHIDEFDFGTVFSILEETKKYQIPRQHQETLSQIEILMEELSVEEIKKLLKEADM